MARKEKSVPIKTCLIYGTAPLSEASEMDAKLLTDAQEKYSNKQKGPGKPTATTGVAEPNQDNVSFSTATLSTFKSSKRRIMALSAISGIKDRRPRPEDMNRFKDLIAEDIVLPPGSSQES